MRTALVRLVAAVAVLAAAVPAGAVPPGAPDCPMFPADNVWHADVSRLPVHARSAAWLASMGGPTRRLHPDFGPAGDGEQPYGIPYVVVDGGHAKVDVSFEYDDESDPGPYPFGPDTPLEGGSDRHALMVDRRTCTLYELFAAEWDTEQPTAGSGAIWDLRSHTLRPPGWTSADAAGLPILPGLLRKDEVDAGSVDHAIRLTPPGPTAASSGPPATRPALRATPTFRPWVPGSACGPTSTSRPFGRTPRWCCGPCSATA